MRLLCVVLLVCAVALSRADNLSEDDPLGKRILERAATVDNDADYVFAEIVENIKDKSPAPRDMAAVELEATITTEQQQQQQQQAMLQQMAAAQAATFFPGYPAANPGFYGGYSYAPQMAAPAAQPYLANMRYAAAPGSSSGSASAGAAGPFANAAYSQFGVPYSAFPPIPPPMPTYLPPPPYIPLVTPAGGGSAGSA